MDGRIAGPHLRQHLLRRNAPVHHPDPLGLAIQFFDPLQKTAQRGFVRRVPRHHFVGQRKTFRRHHQRDDHLHAVRPLVPAVAITTLVPFGKRRIALEIRAGQIVEQHLELHPEQILPAPPQMTEERQPMFQHLVQAPIQRILFRQAEILLQQIGHRAVVKPLPMQPPFAARINQPIDRQRLQHMTPARALSPIRQPVAPKLIHLQLIPQVATHPAGTPLPRTPQLKLIQPHLHAVIGRMNRHFPIRRV